jgi:PAS domain S-box-containing protein
MINIVSKHLNLLQSRPIKVVFLYVAMTLLWILEGPKLIVLLLASTSLKVDSLKVMVDGGFILTTAIMIFFAIRRQLTLHIDSKNQYKMLFHSNPTPMWIYSRRSLKFLQVNNTAICIYGYTAEEFKKMSILDITSPEDQDKTVQQVKNMFYNYNPSGNFEHIKKNGDVFTAKITSHKIYFQNQDCVMVMAEDVTLQHLQDKALLLLSEAEKEYKEELEANIKQLTATLEEKQRLAEVIDRIYNMVIITDPNGVITWVNEAFINTTGYSFDDAVGKTHSFLYGSNPDFGTEEKIIQSVKNKDFSVIEVINYSKTGQGYWVEMTISPIYNCKDDVVRYISVQNIITERKLRDVQIMEQNTVLKKLAWTNSHIVRKPIASILSLVELGEYAESIEELREMHHFIGVCSRELDSITKEVSQEINNRNLGGFMEV